MDNAQPADVVSLTRAQAAIVVACGAALWFAGIFQIRWVAGLGALGDGRTPLVYALIVAATAPVVALVPHVLGLPRAARLHCSAIMAATAALLDGIAVRWTDWYAADPRVVAQSAATLLWAIGVAVALGCVMAQGPARR